NPTYDATIINNSGIQPAYQDIKNIDPMPEEPVPPIPPIPTSGLKLWLKADSPDGAIIKDINNYVNTWVDLSGYTNSSFQTNSSYRPLYVANAINGKPAIRFDGVNDYLNITSLKGNMNQLTFFIVIKPSGLADYNQSIGAVGGWGQFLFHSAANGAIYCGTSAQSRLTAPSGTMVNNEVQGYSYVYAGTGSASKLYKNSSQVASGTLTATPASWTGFIIGANNSNSLKGDIPEIIIYDRALSDSERQSVEIYLSSKYNYPGITPTPVNLSQGKPASSNGAASGYGPEKGNNGVVSGSDGWSSTATTNPWWQVDLGSAKTITKLELIDRPGYDQITTRRNFEVRASNDPNFATYTVLASQGSTAFPDDTTWTADVTDTNQYRYIRFYKTSNEYMFICEFKVWGY
ncbi:MAG TPA: hypothetical protein GXX36_09530, partial [Clostridiaceae bacterium]|nr:hypothetical protein [Clostridiaceae bacterium]